MDKIFKQNQEQWLDEILLGESLTDLAKLVNHRQVVHGKLSN